VPQYVFLGLPIDRDIDGSESPGGFVVSPEALELLPAVFGGELDPDLGHVAVIAVDCNYLPAIGFQYDVTAVSRVDNATNPARSPTAHYTGGARVSGTNSVGFLFNVKPGCVEVTGSIGGTLTHRALAHVTPGALSLVYLFPVTFDGTLGIYCVPGRE